MTLADWYAALGGSYTEVMERLKKEELVILFVEMFVKEDTLTKLKGAMKSGDEQAAFRAVHSLKGNCMSLGFPRLKIFAEAIAEPLRNGRLEEAMALLAPLEKEYERTVDAIQQLEQCEQAHKSGLKMISFS